MKAQIVNFDTENATLDIQGQKLIVPRTELPKEVRVGEEILVNFGATNDELAKAILRELIKEE